MRITSTESLAEMRNKEARNETRCIGCFKGIKELDVVEVISNNSQMPEVEIGDIGAVVMVHENSDAFEVECVLENGDTKWLCALTRDQLKWLQSPA